MIYSKSKLELEANGYAIINDLFSKTEVEAIVSCIDSANLKDDFVSTSQDVHAIRKLLKAIPELKTQLFNANMIKLLKSLADSSFFISKAIYFNKPSTSNWFVPYHQDLSISVDQKSEVEDYINWTYKNEQYGVQPPLHILEDTFTVRIHLDDTTSENGALRVIPKSHLQGVIRVETKPWDSNSEQICEVKKGGIMLMKPLTLHASGRTKNNQQRRVIHLEFNKHKLEMPLQWLEREEIIAF